MKSAAESSRVIALRKARADMVAARTRLLETMAGREEAELRRSPADGGWSAVEVLDHLRTAEGQLVKALVKHERGEPVRIPKRAWFYRLPMTPVFWSIKVPAPKPVRPRPLAELVPSQVIEQLAGSRKALLEYADRTGEERFARMVFPHFVLGRFSGVDWFRFIARHETKHAGQIARVLAG